MLELSTQVAEKEALLAENHERLQALAQRPAARDAARDAPRSYPGGWQPPQAAQVVEKEMWELQRLRMRPGL